MREQVRFSFLLTQNQDKTMKDNAATIESNKYSIQRRELVKHLALKIIKKKQISNGLKLSYKLLGFTTAFVSGLAFYQVMF